MADVAWIEVASANTNSIDGSHQVVHLKNLPICPNMSNVEFRSLIVKLRNAAAYLVGDRIAGLARWDVVERSRVKDWFGRDDDEVRSVLQSRLPRLKAALGSLDPTKVTRWDEAAGLTKACMFVPDSGSNKAAVCKPESDERIIGIYSGFCNSPDADLWRECKLKTLVHECSHFTDVFDSKDVMYGDGVGVKYWAQANADKTLYNADSITMYVAHFDRRLTL
ncbi:M35 family metallo-endopeptidase [Pandoraea sp. NPDC090278]|uniref:M35 family metallo-endopeptidase n=1 Tax=Pandoraea sp. NPDC090278 TaxID=3364391 RepID=UPI00383B572D